MRYRFGIAAVLFVAAVAPASHVGADTAADP